MNIITQTSTARHQQSMTTKTHKLVESNQGKLYNSSEVAQHLPRFKYDDLPSTPVY